MKLKHYYLIVLPLILGIIFISAFSSFSDNTGQTDNSKIIRFSHTLHKDLADCGDCHTSVDSSTTLNDRLLPDHDDCATCHDVESEDNCKLCHINENYEALIQKKSTLHFNHKFHINEQKLKCTDCHKGIGNVEYALQSPGAVPSMEVCYSCHNTNKNSLATNECTACHTSTVNLKPQSHKSANFITTHKFAARSINNNCMMCHDNNGLNSCEDCHDATTGITENNSANDFYQPYSPSSFSAGMKKQQITRVHDINYRFTHGIDAKGKTAECQSCHQIETFCASCHQSKEGDFSLGGIEPVSHLQPNFMIIGVGSGGGEHATLARRDIESCASCHDVQGADPTCIKCHLDSDGIKGTNPRTHPANFMKDEHGDWHTSDGSVCFNCHTNTHQAGQGFCGYCHGAKAQ